MELPVFDPDPRAQPTERADAARNRQRILCAAERLIEAHGVASISMDDVAREAGVGKGTLYRRFGDRASLARALLSAREAAFQDLFIRGCPPLGPGAPAADRLRAFGPGLMDLLEQHSDLILASEMGNPMARFKSGPYGMYRTHLGLLLADAAPGIDTEFHSETLMAPLSAELFVWMRRERSMPLERVKNGWLTLLEGTLAAGATAAPAA